MLWFGRGLCPHTHSCPACEGLGAGASAGRGHAQVEQLL